MILFQIFSICGSVIFRFSLSQGCEGERSLPHQPLSEWRGAEVRGWGQAAHRCQQLEAVSEVAHEDDDLHPVGQPRDLGELDHEAVFLRQFLQRFPVRLVLLQHLALIVRWNKAGQQLHEVQVELLQVEAGRTGKEMSGTLITGRVTLSAITEGQGRTLESQETVMVMGRYQGWQNCKDC